MGLGGNVEVHHYFHSQVIYFTKLFEGNEVYL